MLALLGKTRVCKLDHGGAICMFLPHMGSAVAAGALRGRQITHRKMRNPTRTSVNGGKGQGLPPMAKVVKATRRGDFLGIPGSASSRVVMKQIMASSRERAVVMVAAHGVELHLAGEQGH